MANFNIYSDSVLIVTKLDVQPNEPDASNVNSNVGYTKPLHFQ